MTFELAKAQVSAASGVPPPSNFGLTGRIWHIPARLARHARQRVLKISPESGVPHLLAAALRPASTRLTSTIESISTKGGPTRRGRSRCAPGHTGHRHATTTTAKQTPRLKPGAGTISKQASGTLND
jgi:hypothetical protein